MIFSKNFHMMYNTFVNAHAIKKFENTSTIFIIALIFPKIVEYTKLSSL